MADAFDEFTREYLDQLCKHEEFRADMERPPLFGLGLPRECDQVSGLKTRVSNLEARVEDLECRLTYAEFLAGLSSPVTVVVCPEYTPVDLIARKLWKGRR